MSRVKLALAQAQAAMKANGGKSPSPSMPILFAAQLSPLITKLLVSEAGSGTSDALRKALPVAIQHTSQVIVAPESSPEDRNRASDTLFWLFSLCVRTDTRRQQLDVKKEEAAARRARALAMKEGVILKVAKERKKIQKALDKL